MPRTTEDKLKSINTLFEDKEWQTKSANWIAQKCRVATTFVIDHMPPTLVRLKSKTGKDGRTIDTPNIGKGRKAKTEVRIT